MANLDTTSKRRASIQIAMPYAIAPPSPDGTLAQGDRQHIAWSYSGINASPPVSTPSLAQWQLEPLSWIVGRAKRAPRVIPGIAAVLAPLAAGQQISMMEPGMRWAKAPQIRPTLDELILSAPNPNIAFARWSFLEPEVNRAGRQFIGRKWRRAIPDDPMPWAAVHPSIGRAKWSHLEPEFDHAARRLKGWKWVKDIPDEPMNWAALNSTWSYALWSHIEPSRMPVFLIKRRPQLHEKNPPFFEPLPVSGVGNHPLFKGVSLGNAMFERLK